MGQTPYCLSRVAIATGDDPDASESALHSLEALAPSERALYSTLPVGQRAGWAVGRRAEWAAGRHAGRAALRSLVGEAVETLAIGRAEDGAPVVLGYDGTAPLVSISHGHKEAVAVAGFRRHLGVDLCELAEAPRVRRVATRFIGEAERALAEAVGGDFGWAALWALKEAGAKAYRLGLFAGGLRATTLSSLEPPIFLAHRTHPKLQAVLIRSKADVVAVAYSDD